MGGVVNVISRRPGRQRDRELLINRSARGATEVAVRGAAARQTWVAGAAVEYDAYRPQDLPRFQYTFVVPGIFVQDDIQLTKWTAITASGRLDVHNEYGVFFSPRLSALIRGGRWHSRLSVGTGFFGPSALTEETEATGLARLEVPDDLRAEQGQSASLDIGRTDGPASYTLTLFASRVLHPIDVDRSRELDEGSRRGVPLTPRHSAGVVGMWARENVGRIGVKWYYTGRQRLEANPYRAASEPYVVVGLLAERQVRRVRIFVNGENLTNVRQTRWDPLLRPDRAPDRRWTVDGWAPLEGRNINGGVRFRF